LEMGFGFEISQYTWLLDFYAKTLELLRC
jgi:hypothetical protein